MDYGNDLPRMVVLFDDDLYHMMIDYKNKHDFKEAAISGVSLLQKYKLTYLIDSFVYQKAFNNIEDESFYRSIIQTVLDYKKM